MPPCAEPKLEAAIWLRRQQRPISHTRLLWPKSATFSRFLARRTGHRKLVERIVGVLKASVGPGRRPASARPRCCRNSAPTLAQLTAAHNGSRVHVNPLAANGQE